MKKLTKFALMFLCGAFALGFTSCGDDDDDNGGSSDLVSIPAATLQSAVTNYVNNVVNPTYDSLQQSAVRLDAACTNLYNKKQAGTLTQDDIDAACNNFKIARRFWEQSEAFLYGAATNDHIDPHIDSWPLDQDQLATALTSSQVIAGITGSNPAQYVYTSNGQFDSTMGFHGLEFILFRNGAPRTLEAFNATNEDGDGLNPTSKNYSQNVQQLRGVTTLEEAAFAAAVAGDIRNMTTLLAYEWNGSSTLGNYLTNSASWVLAGTRNNGHAVSFSEDQDPEEDDAKYTSLSGTYTEAVSSVGQTNTTLFSTWNENLQNILVGGCSNISQEVYTQKLAQAYRVATGRSQEGDAADYIESPYSKRSFKDYQDNIYSIRNSLYGVRGTSTGYEPGEADENVTIQSNSVMAILRDYGYSGYSALSSALDNALSTLDKAKKSGTQFIDDPKNQQVADCISAVQALDEQLNLAGTWCARHIRVTQ